MHHIALLGYLSINDWKASQYHLGTGCISENDWKASQDTSGTGCNSKSDWKASWWGYFHLGCNFQPGWLFKMTEMHPDGVLFTKDAICSRDAISKWLKGILDSWWGFGNSGCNLRPVCLFKMTEMHPDCVLDTSLRMQYLARIPFQNDWNASWLGFVYQRRNLQMGCHFKITERHPVVVLAS